MKKLLTGLLMLALVIACICALSPKTNAATSGYYTYRISGGEATITDCSASISGAVYIPETLSGYPVTTIGSSAFSNCDSLTSITIPYSVTYLGHSAFENCDSLISVTIGDSVTTIGNSAFKNCYSLTSIFIGNAVTTIDYSAFENCTSLTRVIIPNSVTTIGDSAFENCNRLTYNVYDNGLYLGNSTNPYIVLMGTTNLSVRTCIVHPDTKFIGDNAFYCTRITSVTIPDSVTSIGERTFSGCSALVSVSIGDGVTSIGDWAFSDCPKLAAVTIPDSVTHLGNYVFENCTGLTDATIGNGIATIPFSAFVNCANLTSVTIPASVTAMGEYAFAGCENLTGVYITDLAAWCNISFEDSTSNPLYCAHNLYLNGLLVTHLMIPEGVASIGRLAFDDLNVTTVTIPSTVTYIGPWAFETNTIENVYYSSNSTRWNQINFTVGNENLTGAMIHYNHVHDYELLPPVIEPATCQNAGYIDYTCSLGETYREILPQLAHTPAETGTVVPPTCTEDGYTGIFCTTCNTLLSTYDIVPSPGHNMVLAPASPATCTQPGLTAGTICERCDYIGVPQTEIPATNHNFENNVCTECGEPEFKPGDVTGNGEIDSADGLLLMQYLNGWELTDIEESALDVSGDGKVDSLDGLLLMRYLNGWKII